MGLAPANGENISETMIFRINTQVQETFFLKGFLFYDITLKL